MPELPRVLIVEGSPSDAALLVRHLTEAGLAVQHQRVDTAEGMRAALTDAPHMHLYVIYPALLAFATLFLTLGLRNFQRRVLS